MCGTGAAVMALARERCVERRNSRAAELRSDKLVWRARWMIGIGFIVSSGRSIECLEVLVTCRQGYGRPMYRRSANKAKSGPKVCLEGSAGMKKNRQDAF